MSTPTLLCQTHAVLIGEFELCFVIHTWYSQADPGGWMWSAKGEEEMTRWMTGSLGFPSATCALAAATAYLTERFG